MKKHQIKPKVLFLLFMIIFSNCSKEDIILEQNIKNSVLIETVSINEAKNLFAESGSLGSGFYSNKGETYVVPDLSKITQEAIKNTSELLTVIPATTPDKNVYSRVLLLKIDNKIESVVFHMVSSTNGENINFTGKIFITELDGSFLYGYTVDNGELVSKLIRGEGSKKASQLASLKPGEDDCPFSNRSWCQLEEIVLTTGSGSGSSNNSIDVSNVYDYSGGYGSGGGSASSGFSNDSNNSWNFSYGGIEHAQQVNTTILLPKIVNVLMVK